MISPPSKHEVHERLWVGNHACTGEPLIEQGFTLLILAAFNRPSEGALQPGLRIIQAPLTDDAFEIVKGDAERAGRAAVAAHYELKRGGQVLITCVEGINRSAWIAGIVIRLQSPIPNEQIILQIQQRREGALYSWFFQEHLRKLTLPQTLMMLLDNPDHR